MNKDKKILELENKVLKLKNDILKYRQDIDSSVDLINTYREILDAIERNGYILKNLIGIQVKQQ
tara:strand:+ start:27059 stop:27250 length:192 start_codon:yes stop_codon:yes gene_type:complete